MYCLTNMCYVCLEKKDKSLININNSSVNQDIIHIISYIPFNLTWLKTKQIILICAECCLRLRRTYQFLAMCHKNSSLMQGYVNKFSTASISNINNEAELHVDLNNIQVDINEIKLENEEIDIFQNEPIIEETVVFVNVDDSFVKEEDSWQREEVDDKEESPMDNNVTENNDNETDSEICDNTHDTGNIVIKQSVGTIGEQNFPYQCKVCSIAFPTREQLNCHIIYAGHVTKRFCKYCKQSVDIADFDDHIKQHDNEAIFCCEFCGEMIYELNTFIRHSRIHRPHKCLMCPMQFDTRLLLRQHLTVHTGIRRDQCKYCNRKFARPTTLMKHLASRTCQKDTNIYVCTTCMKIFDSNKKCGQHAAQHIRHECTICHKTFHSKNYCKKHQKLVHHIE